MTKKRKPLTPKQQEELEQCFIRGCISIILVIFIFYPNLSIADSVTESIVDIQYELNTIKQHEIILYEALKKIENEVKQCKK